MSRLKIRAGLAVLVLIALIASSIGTVSAYTYNRQGAVDYARANAYKWVPGSWFFEPLGRDCTNFVSQTLYIGGGWPQRGTDYWTPQYQWYFNGVSGSSHSNSWTAVKEFGSFVLTSTRGTEISFGRNDVWARPARFRTGDIMQVDWTGDGTWDHTMIITGITGNDVLVTYHSNDQLDFSISKMIGMYPNSKFRVFLLKDTFVY